VKRKDSNEDEMNSTLIDRLSVAGPELDAWISEHVFGEKPRPADIDDDELGEFTSDREFARAGQLLIDQADGNPRSLDKYSSDMAGAGGWWSRCRNVDGRLCSVFPSVEAATNLIGSLSRVVGHKRGPIPARRPSHGINHRRRPPSPLKLDCIARHRIERAYLSAKH
jgi:hypothetical protein